MFRSLVKKLIGLSYNTKKILQLLADSLIILFSFYFAMLLRLDVFIVFTNNINNYVVIYLIPVTLLIIYILGIYNDVIRYIGKFTILKVLYAAIISILFFYLIIYYRDFYVSRAVPIIYGLIFFTLMIGVRFAAKTILSYEQIRRENIVIYGTDKLARQLLGSLNAETKYNVTAFIDDDHLMYKKNIDNIKVHRFADLKILKSKYDIKAILVAKSQLNQKIKNILFDIIGSLNIQLKTIPHHDEIFTNSIQTNNITDIPIEDLLGRDEVDPINELLEKNIKDKNVLITGAGGSIGSELSLQILKKFPKKLIVLDISEFSLYNIDAELKNINQNSRYIKSKNIISALGSVLDANLIERIIDKNNINTVYHCAAYKHVPLVENNFVEGLRNNIEGTKNLLDISVNCKVENFTLISTDKAVRPTNIMGASKRLAELICLNKSKVYKDININIVRFGNVLNSSGSVIPLFKKQILAGGPVTVTHPEMTRFFMTISEAAQLVIQASALDNSNGEIYVLDMGKPVKITDLAIKMINLNGFNYTFKDEINKQDKLININFIGIRNGEKLYEELFYGINSESTLHPKILKSRESNNINNLEDILINLKKVQNTYEYNDTKNLLIKYDLITMDP